MSMFRAFLPKYFVVLLAGLWVVGCTSTQKAGIVVSLVKVEAAEMASANNKVVLQLRLQNENLTPVALSQTKHKVYLNGVYYGEAIGTKPVALMERGDVRYEVTLTLADAGAAARLREVLQGGVVSYRLESRMECESGDEELNLVANDSGQINQR